MKSKWFYVPCLFMAFTVSSPAEAAFVFKDGKLRDADMVATLPCQDHFKLGMTAIDNCNWEEAAKQFRIVVANFRGSTYAQEGSFYLGVAEFNLDEFDFANEAFTAYLNSKNNPKFFQDAIEYKFSIAECLANGGKRRFLGSKKLPKWASGRTLALKIYDEVISALPSSDLAARALYAKGCLYWQLKEYRRAIENFQLVYKRFPKHELAPESYVAISNIFVEQSRKEFQNPDILSFAEINHRRFKQEFPREERVADVQDNLANIKEYYAQGLYETGRFYERIDQPNASVIYYQNAIRQFPDTDVAKCAKERLNKLRPGSQECSKEAPLPCD